MFDFKDLDKVTRYKNSSFYTEKNHEIPKDLNSLVVKFQFIRHPSFKYRTPNLKHPAFSNYHPDSIFNEVKLL